MLQKWLYHKWHQQLVLIPCRRVIKEKILPQNHKSNRTLALVSTPLKCRSLQWGLKHLWLQIHTAMDHKINACCHIYERDFFCDRLFKHHQKALNDHSCTTLLTYMWEVLFKGLNQTKLWPFSGAVVEGCNAPINFKERQFAPIEFYHLHYSVVWEVQQISKIEISIAYHS